MKAGSPQQVSGSQSLGKLFVLGSLWLASASLSASATNLDFGVSYPAAAQVGVSDLPLLGGKAAAGVSTRGVGFGFGRTLALPPLGAVSVQSGVQLAWQGGYRLTSQATATAGPVALNIAGRYFTVAAADLDPLAAWALSSEGLRPADLRSKGWAADLNLRYRVRRDLIAVLGGELGGQSNAYGGVEYRRDLTRTLPPTEGDDPTALPETELPETELPETELPETELPETERTGTLTYRAGARAGQDILAVTAGIGYAREDGKSFSLDAQLGTGLALVASATLPEVLGEGSNLRAYAAYEPWRKYANPLRLGLEASKAVGPGTLQLDLRGGQNHAGETGFGVGLRYSWPLGAQAGQGVSASMMR